MARAHSHGSAKTAGRYLDIRAGDTVLVIT